MHLSGIYTFCEVNLKKSLTLLTKTEQRCHQVDDHVPVIISCGPSCGRQSVMDLDGSVIGAFGVHARSRGATMTI